MVDFRRSCVVCKNIPYNNKVLSIGISVQWFVNVVRVQQRFYRGKFCFSCILTFILVYKIIADAKFFFSFCKEPCQTVNCSAGKAILGPGRKDTHRITININRRLHLLQSASCQVIKYKCKSQRFKVDTVRNRPRQCKMIIIIKSINKHNEEERSIYTLQQQLL